MAKQGLSWFRIDVNFDDKFELVCAEYGSVAFEVIVRLWQKIYNEGYYCEWNTEVALLFAKRLGMGGNVVSEIVNCCLRRNLFNEEKYKAYGILTSSGIQQWYIDSTVKRVEVKVIEEYLTIDASKFGKNVVIINKNDGRNSKNDGRNAHSTVQYSTDSTDSTYKEPDGSTHEYSLIKQIIDYLNLKCDTAYKPSADINKRHIKARINEGYTLDDFKSVIDKKVSEWKGTEFEKFLRPETLFGTKFESYLNSKITAKESAPKYGQIGIDL